MPRQLEKDKISELGNFFEVDINGYVVNSAAISKVPSHWLVPINDIKKACIKYLGTRLSGLYIKGSVVQGRVIDGVSDLDVLGFVTEKMPGDFDWIDSVNKVVTDRSHFVSNIDLWLDTVQSFFSEISYQVMLKTQAVCIYGNDLSKEVKPFKPGKEIAINVYKIRGDIKRFRKYFEEKPNDLKLLKHKCRSIMKRIIRTGFELVIDKVKKYTRDLYPCFKEFCKYYPEHKHGMQRALELAINPATNTEMIINVLDDIGNWISKEAEIQFQLDEKYSPPS